MLKHCEEVAKELNDFLANAVKNLNIPNIEKCDSLAENINDPTLNAVVKLINHPSILAIASQYENRANLSFNFVSKKGVLTEIKALDISKFIQEIDIPVHIIKTNDNFFEEAICYYIDKSLVNGKFPNWLKSMNIMPRRMLSRK